MNELKKCTVVFKFNNNNISASYQTKSILLRIVQEFLQNSIKHAKCKTIKVSIEKDTKTLVLILEDDGIGFDSNSISTNGIGLNNIKKRAEIIGAKLSLVSNKEKGTRLTITLLNE